MSAWPPQIGTGTGPKYRRLADALAGMIRAGDLKPNSRLPSHRDLAYQLGIAVGSVARAYEVLAELGLVRGEVGRGTVVRDITHTEWIGLEPRTGMVDLGLVRAPRIEDQALIEAAGRKTLATLGAQWSLLSLGEFCPERGEDRHRRAVSDWLRRRRVPASDDSVAITVGSQEALLSALMTTTRRGAVVLAEELTFSSLRDLAATLGLSLQPVALNEQGMDPEDLMHQARRRNAGVVVVQPTCQVPTAASMGEERRRQIADVARRAGLIIVEYDPWPSLSRREATPLAALAPQQVIYIEPFSSELMPGLGAALVHCSAPLAQRFLATRHALLLSTPRLISEVVTHWIVSGVAQALTVAASGICLRRMELAIRVAPGLVQRGNQGNPFLWADVGPHWQAEDFVREAETHGVIILPAGRFALSRANIPHFVRIALSSALSDSELEQALRDLSMLASLGHAKE